jgi:hypothetical protein
MAGYPQRWNAVEISSLQYDNTFARQTRLERKRRMKKLKQRQLGDYKTYKKKKLAEWYPVCAWLGPFMLV